MESGLFCPLLKFSIIKVKNSKQHVFDLRHPSSVQQITWNNERTQEAMESQVFTFFKAITPLSQGCMVPNTRSTGPLVLPSTFQFAKPLQVHYVLGNPGMWVHTEVELREGSPGVPTPSSVSGCHPRNELELEKISRPTLRVKLRHLQWDGGTSSSVKHPGYRPSSTPARGRALNLKHEGARFHIF